MTKCKYVLFQILSSMALLLLIGCFVIFYLITMLSMLRSKSNLTIIFLHIIAFTGGWFLISILVALLYRFHLMSKYMLRLSGIKCDERAAETIRDMGITRYLYILSEVLVLRQTFTQSILLILFLPVSLLNAGFLDNSYLKELYMQMHLFKISSPQLERLVSFINDSLEVDIPTEAFLELLELCARRIDSGDRAEIDLNMYQ